MSRVNRIALMLTDEELTAIDDHRFANRIGTRAEAVRTLCQIGAKHTGTLDALRKAEAFIAGFEDDEMQEGVAELLVVLRGAIAEMQAPA